MSAANYKHFRDQDMHISNYISKHPLTDMIGTQSWNNIPLLLRELLEMLSDAMVAQDIHTWERKCLNNERFIRM